jgi:hypothetical protein
MISRDRAHFRTILAAWVELIDAIESWNDDLNLTKQQFELQAMNSTRVEANLSELAQILRSPTPPDSLSELTELLAETARLMSEAYRQNVQYFAFSTDSPQNIADRSDLLGKATSSYQAAARKRDDLARELNRPRLRNRGHYAALQRYLTDAFGEQAVEDYRAGRMGQIPAKREGE